MPYVRGGVSATWLEAWIRQEGHSVGGKDLAPGGYAVAGLEFTIRRQWLYRVLGTAAFTAGLRFEAGYAHLGRFSLDGQTSTSGLVDDYRSPLGRLTLHGATLNAALVISF